MISEKAVEAAAFQIKCDLGCTITAARLAAQKALTAALSLPDASVECNSGATAWQPIETAPKDGTSVLICDADLNRNICFWGDCLGSMRRRGQHSIMTWCIVWSDNDEQGGFNSVDDAKYWQPLPAPPVLIAEKSGSA